MEPALDISDVVRRTGLTARALRFYEARGLVTPLRSASGRRFYGPAQLERVGQILALKRAGLTLAQIQRLSRGRALDLPSLVEASSPRSATASLNWSRREPCSSTSSPASTAASPSMPRPSAR